MSAQGDPVELLEAARRYLAALWHGHSRKKLIMSCVEYDYSTWRGYRRTKKQKQATGRTGYAPSMAEREERLLGLMREYADGDDSHADVFAGNHGITRVRAAQILAAIDEVAELEAIVLDVRRGLDVDLPVVVDDDSTGSMGNYYDLDRLDTLHGCGVRLGVGESTIRVWRYRYESFPRPVFDTRGVALYDHYAVSAWHEARERAKVSK